MTNLELARFHGLLVNRLIEDGKWHRVGTTDKPHSTNGAYAVTPRGMAVQNWATMQEAVFYADNALPVDSVKARDINRQAYEDRLSLNKKAASKAGWILSNTELKEHPYLVNKGFEGLKGLVHDEKLIIPMRLRGDLVGLQMIDNLGGKRFIYGQVCKGATHVIGQGKLNVICEGYASGVSAHKALLMASIPCKVHVCFSANNMIEVAKTLKQGLIIADHDKSKTGLNAALKIGWNYWMSPNEGDDINDYTRSNSYFRISQELKKIMM